MVLHCADLSRAEMQESAADAAVRSVLPEVFNWASSHGLSSVESDVAVDNIRLGRGSMIGSRTSANAAEYCCRTEEDAAEDA